MGICRKCGKECKNKFCSRGCYWGWLSDNPPTHLKDTQFEKVAEEETKHCESCGEPFERPIDKKGYLLSSTCWDKRKYCSLQCAGEAKRLVFNKLGRAIRSTQKYVYWRKGVLSRDGYTCQCCESPARTAHHIKHFAEIIFENEITNLDEALKCADLWDIDNGLTVCYLCHREIHKAERKIK